MLVELSVQNLALIEDVRVELAPGFCAWTGETGAGKTLLLEALGLLLGERGSAELLRAGAEELQVAGRFDISAESVREAVEEALGAACPDGELVVSRRLSRAGRSYCYANGQPVAVNSIRRLRGVLVDVHGQRESQSLLEPAYQLRLLDSFGGLEEMSGRYREAAAHVRTLRRRHAELTSQRQQRQRELSLLRFEREELDSAAVRVGELPELARERERLAHLGALLAFLHGGVAGLYEEDGSVSERVGKLVREAQTWQELDPGLAEVGRRLGALAAETQDIADVMRDLAQRFEAEPGRREAVEERYQLLRRLEKKYGRAADELPAYRASLDEQEKKLDQDEAEQESVQTELVEGYGALRQVGTELSRARQRVAKKLAAEAQRELRALGMAGAQLHAELEPLTLGDDPESAEVPELGFERMELMLAANPGEPAWPLRKVASGGELSRTMLALKTVLAGHDRVGTLVFDEVDANVGGRLGDVLGEKLAALGRSRQVICVTHLPQVASYAPNQWTIRKERRGKRTVTTIRLLSAEERLDELASMLRGEARGETTRKEAEAMLEAARARW